MMDHDNDEDDQYVSDEELAQEIDIPEPPQSPSSDKCGICPFKSYNVDPDERTITLKRKKSLQNCNRWAKKRKMNIKFKVRIHKVIIHIFHY